MDLDSLAKRLREEPAALSDIVTALSAADAAALVAHIKAEAERHYWINANTSLELAELIVRIGQVRDDTWQTALGTMARADALRFLGQIEAAWRLFETAGDLFREIGDEVGWARTRIGRLLCCVELNRVADALSDIEVARDIFLRHGEHERLLGLYNNTAIVYDLLGEYQRALKLYHAALAIAESLGDRAKPHLGLLYIDMGYTYKMLGHFRQASAYYERARTIFVERHETRAIALAELNIAYVAMAQGQHRRALQLLHHARDLYVAEKLPLDATHVGRPMIECYLLLNRYVEARDLAQQVAAAYRTFGASYKEALTLLHLATAEAELSNLAAAQAALDAAEPIFAALDATIWVATTRLRRGRIVLRQGDSARAKQAADVTAPCFEANGQQVDYAAAMLLHGQASFAEGDLGVATSDGLTALRIARACNMPPLRYSAHLLLGHVAETQGRLTRAARHYVAAMTTVKRVQSGLTITLRPSFLEDKGEAMRALIGLYLRTGRAVHAFEALERAKSQALLGYLANHEQLRWSDDNPESRALIEELNRLREEHQWFYRLAHEQPAGEDEHRSAIDSQRALEEVTARERRMRAITEQLYLEGEGTAADVSMPRLRDVQGSLDADTLLIEFYNDGTHLWAFTLDRDSLEVHPLPAKLAAIDRLLPQIRLNFNAALNVGPHAPVVRGLAGLAERMLQRLYAALIEPVAARLAGRRRLVIVPYGALHYLPFHLLHSGSEHLIERYEVVILPAAGLATHRVPARPAGALALAHSWDGQLPQTLAEARLVQELFGGDICCEQAACRTVLQAPPVQVLHIAAHGEHRLDQPDLSYIQLGDGQLYTDDLLQHDLSYELVTLSACETGRANVAAGDEPIGLGRGFLYAGAGALITSLWRVTDDSAIGLMERFYGALRRGESKAAALRDAQRAMLAEEPQLHPAFWGAFQLVGDAGPLSAQTSAEPPPLARDRPWPRDKADEPIGAAPDAVDETVAWGLALR